MGGRLFVIVDGNNLANYLYVLPPGAPVTLEIDRQMAAHFSTWARRQARPVTVELCLDPRRQRPEEPDHVQVYIAAPEARGDDIVLDRVRVHLVNGEDCLVVSDDQELCADVSEFQVETWSLARFVRCRDARRPAFAPAPHRVRPGLLPQDARPEPLTGGGATPVDQASAGSFKQRLQQFEGQRQARRQQEQIDHAIARTLAWQTPSAAPTGEVTPDALAGQPLPQYYRLSLETWPAGQGARFLVESFCPHHRAMISPVVGDPAGLQVNDLPVLAELLLECCGQESDFVRRGGSLMDRVRLALLLAGPAGLALPELGHLAGAPPAALQRKLRRSDGKWVTAG